MDRDDMMARLDALDWQPMDCAPRDGTEVYLTWMEDGRPAEVYPMVWNRFAGNQLVQDGKGIWVLRSTDGFIYSTWSESDPEGAPTHWAHIPKEQKDG